MARKRLTPARPTFLTDPAADGPPRATDPGSSRAPIAEIAADAAGSAAFHEVAEELTRARAEGRLIQRLPLDAVVDDHLTRDRLSLDADAFRELKSSLASRGQQTPIEVVPLRDGTGDGAGAGDLSHAKGFGLISGWRRLRALRDLFAETADERFGTVLALVRPASERAQAYLAMVEENEIRADLSFYERAQVVRAAVRDGAFADETAALHGLFPAVSYSKRSKIKSFLTLVDRLDGVLRHPARLSERMGLALVRHLDGGPAAVARLRGALADLDPADPDAEAAALSTVLASSATGKKPSSDGTDGRGKGRRAASRPISEAIVDGLEMTVEDRSIVLSGPAVTRDLADRIVAMIRDGDGD